MTRTVRWTLGISAIVLAVAVALIVLLPRSDAPSTATGSSTAAGPDSPGKPVDARSNTPKITTLTPFDAQGAPTTGWEVDDKAGSTPIDCSYNEPSPSASTDNILLCAPSAAAADSCTTVPTKPTALCLIDPFNNHLTRYATTTVRTGVVHAPQTPQPIALILDNGTKCRLRNGGSWSSPEANPTYVGYYFCPGNGFQAIWAPPSGPAITQQPTGWTVQLGAERGPLTQHQVTEAFYVAISH
ncbi:hypothetical protein ABZ942_29110 [Nocardia sp. NPDC046473]|uniref:hypothetical protein n=1 Tax=Nocardia sp. NPDC046473 TaxID=3155733 RepID=UPI0033FB4AF9